MNYFIVQSMPVLPMKCEMNKNRYQVMFAFYVLSSTNIELVLISASSFPIMRCQTGFLLIMVCLSWSQMVEGNPHLTEWWSKGVTTVKNFVLGAAPAPWHQDTVWRIEFDPDAGLRKSPDYQQYFGHRGERLVHVLGSGDYRSGQNRNENQMFSQFSAS